MGLVHYIATFLLHLGDLTAVLTPLNIKDADKKFPMWDTTHPEAFNAIKELVLSNNCIMVIDHKILGDCSIFVMSNASDKGTGAMLLFGSSCHV